MYHTYKVLAMKLRCFTSISCLTVKMMHQFLKFAGICFLGSSMVLTACNKPLPKVPATIVALQQMQDFATAEYTLSKVVKASDNQTWFKWGERKILITCVATVKAGIDFGALDTRYVSQDGKHIKIQLPPAKIISVSLPPDQIKVSYQDIGFFRSNFTIAEQNNLMKQAENQMIAQAKNLGILEDAKRNTRAWLTSYLLNIGFEEVDIQFDTSIQLNPALK